MRQGSIIISISLILSLLVMPIQSVLAYTGETPSAVDETTPIQVKTGATAAEEDVSLDPITKTIPEESVVPSDMPPIVTTEVAPIVTVPETTPAVIITTLNVSSTIEYIEIFNQSDSPIDIASLKIVASRNGEEACTLVSMQTGWLQTREFLSLGSPSGAIAGMSPLSGDCALTSDITRIELYQNDTRLQLIEGIQTTQWLRHKSTVSTVCADKTIPTLLKQTGSAANDYIVCATTPNLRTSLLYIPPSSTNGLTIVEIMSDSRSCPPSDKSYDCFDFVKLKNTTDVSINLANYRLRTGASTSSASASNSFHWQQPTLNPVRDELMLLPGDYFTLTKKDTGDPISLTNGDGNVWIEDYYGIKSYQAVSYRDMDLVAASGKSWAYDQTKDVWRFGIPSPYGSTKFYIPPIGESGSGSAGGSSLKPCRDDQYRSEVTNRCRNVVISGSLQPCKEGQYRSEETNRCRSIALAAASILKPCADNQFRNPLTNRCKTIASSEDPVDCGEGRERNPTTNRCRNIVQSGIPEAAFAVQPVKDIAKAFVGWWALGGVLLFGIGYGVLEWRNEIRSAIRRATQFLTKK